METNGKLFNHKYQLNVNKLNLNFNEILKYLSLFILDFNRFIFLNNKICIDSLISLFIRSKLIHILIDLSQMQPKSNNIRMLSLKSVHSIIWIMNKKYVLILKHSQLPFLPFIKCNYINYEHYQINNNLYTKQKLVMVIFHLVVHWFVCLVNQVLQNNCSYIIIILYQIMVQEMWL